MDNNNLILIEHFCANCEIEHTFINALGEYGLIEVVVIENHKYIQKEQLKDVEKMVRFHYELNINLEGIDAISNLLKQIDHLQEELNYTRNRLRLYEDD
ncbi:MAG: chaperone modulator CbpM [Brumimicrobium sp.]